MFVVRASYWALLEVIATHCSLEYTGLVSEVVDNGTLLCGVELVLPAPTTGSSGATIFFWSPVQTTCCGAYEQASLKAISYLQSVYGFLVVDYSFQGLVAPRSIIGLALCCLLMVALLSLSSSISMTQHMRSKIGLQSLAQLIGHLMP
ncbi:hypothetical protein BS78_06G048200 [Paspalum vaginatum]|nr:hypothetical protein BS78_06G048200 [Paspalum vaginatum]